MNKAVADLPPQLYSGHFFYFTALLLAILPIRNLVVPVMIMLIISWLINEPIKMKVERFKKNKMIWLFSLPFIFYFLGMIYTENYTFGWRDIELKLSLLIFPVIIGSTSFPLKRHKNALASVFVYSSALWALVSIVYGAIEFQQIPTYSMMDLLMHPSYLAMYFNTALLFSFFLLLRTDLKKSHKKFLIAAFILLSVGVWLCLSKTGILVWCLLIFGIVLYNSLARKKLRNSILLFIFFVVVITSAIVAIPRFEMRFSNMLSISHDLEKIDKTTTESSRVRVLIWAQTLELIKEKPLIGTGTGDIKDELFVKYRNAGMTGALENKLNVHNQFLQVFATLGIFAFLVFLLTLILPSLMAVNTKNWLYLSFILVFGINLLFESMLEKQDGVIFYAFLNALLFFHFNPDSTKNFQEGFPNNL